MDLARKINHNLELYPTHFNRLRSHYGLTEETIQQSGLFSADSKLLNQILKRKDIECEGIVIPYLSKDLDRVRLDTPISLNSNEVKYLSPSGSKNSLYIPNSLREILQDPSRLLYFTEGELKALKAIQEGFPCIGLPGIWGFLSNGKLLEDFNLIEFKHREVVVVLDSDAEYNLNVHRAGVYFAIELAKLGAKPRLITLPEFKEKSNEDRIR